MNDKELHGLARATADALVDPDRKQLRFNEIVAAARRFYPSDLERGIKELVQSCDRASNDLYCAKAPMWKVLTEQYWWMAPEVLP